MSKINIKNWTYSLVNWFIGDWAKQFPMILRALYSLRSSFRNPLLLTFLFLVISVLSSDVWAHCYVFAVLFLYFRSKLGGNRLSLSNMKYMVFHTLHRNNFYCVLFCLQVFSCHNAFINTGNNIPLKWKLINIIYFYYLYNVVTNIYRNIYFFLGYIYPGFVVKKLHLPLKWTHFIFWNIMLVNGIEDRVSYMDDLKGDSNV